MKKTWVKIKSFFFPSADKPIGIRILPYAVLGLLTLTVLGAATWTWEYTNSPNFCGLTCHTMPPQYSTYLVSPHARVTCVDCHLGRETITKQVVRKLGEFRIPIAMITGQYEYPIRAHNMRPANEACEQCHFPELFSSDKLLEVKQYTSDEMNTLVTTFLLMKTGGGTKREGLGYGIHWHTENPVYYYALDAEKQEIPYVRVVHEDGTVTEYVDSEAKIDPAAIAAKDLQKMDCITCHNRASHQILKPEEAVDLNLARGLISSKIPEIKAKGVEVLRGQYASTDAALAGIAALKDFYQAQYADFYQANAGLVDQAVKVLQDTFTSSVFPEQKFDWDSHPNNIGHQLSAGCFRCHDGKHLDAAGEAIRLECNICHAIPVVGKPGQIVTNIALNRGVEPPSHLNANWINLHRQVFDQTCSNCHTTDDPGGTSNTSFCSNSACHGSTWTFAGFDAPGIRQVLMEQAKLLITPTSIATPPPPTATPSPTAAAQTTPAPGAEPTAATPGVTFAAIAPILENKCSACHGAGGMMGLDVTSYQSLMAGGENGPVVVAGDPAGSLLVQKQSGDTPHYAQLSAEELELVKEWIAGGALEK